MHGAWMGTTSEKYLWKGAGERQQIFEWEWMESTENERAHQPIGKQATQRQRRLWQQNSWKTGEWLV
jgi:hypothetical protein